MSRDALSITRLTDGLNIEINQAMLDLLGYKTGELMGKSSLALGVWADPKDRENFIEKLRQDASFRDEKTQFRRKNGQVFWVLLSATVMRIEDADCIFTVARDLSEARAAEDEIKDLAFYDRVTRLPNRRLLLDRLAQALVGDSRMSRIKILLHLNLDDFATVNNTLGHQIGDLLLQEVGRRLMACIHEADTAARFGADEFVVVFEATSETTEGAAEEAEVLGEKILATLCQPYVFDEDECKITASIGITVIAERRETPHGLLKQASIAMQQAKAAGGNTMRFFSPSLQAAVNVRAAMKNDLIEAIHEHQFMLYYQPQVDSTGLIGSEALIRWKHPIRGIVPPYEFIPLAEETGLILALGEWAFETACMQTVSWAARKAPPHLQIAVNISSRQFCQPDFVENILTTIARTGANPRNLKLELTESMLANDIEDVIAKMEVLKSHGLSFSLDDFGTGYSSLSYLKRLPLDQLKIDRAFVSDILLDIASAAIAETIISLGRAMGLSVIAEGVETEEQRAFLADLGTHSFQGYLFSRPLPLEEFERDWMHLSSQLPL
jgi:diguanylate cyclase (GGDEF)-like protein/PAS domain S-box-containing protein